MTNIREFIRNLGDNAAKFFDTKPETVNRWLKTGSIPMKAVEKVLLAVAASAPTTPQPEVPQPSSQPEADVAIDPLTHLPSNLDRRLPDIQAAPGHAPQVIEMSPTEQSWGINLTRPGRVPQRVLPPMKIRKENGQNIAYVEQPKPITVLPAEMGDGAPGWNEAYDQKPTKDESGIKKA